MAAQDIRKVFNDPIHGSIELHPMLVRIIDTPQFQRLRFIKQMGGVYYVYPGASHNRFEHSIGVAHLAGKLLKALREKQPELEISDKDILCVQIAGLCHDLGHGPFSHLFDNMVIPKIEPGSTWKHEEASIKMFKYLVETNKLEFNKPDLTALDFIFIKELIHSEHRVNARKWGYKGRPEEKSFLYEIVANKLTGIDVDKMDYLARDCYHLGFPNNFDHNRFIQMIRVCEVPINSEEKRRRICIRDKERYNLHILFNSRYRVFSVACTHRVVCSVQLMIADALVEAQRSGAMDLSGAKEDMEKYTALTDRVFEEILNSDSAELEESKSILNRILSRELYRHVCSIRMDGAEGGEELNLVIELLNHELLDNNLQFLRNDLNYGQGPKNPLENMYFYTKNAPNTARPLSELDDVLVFPNRFQDTFINLYDKRLNQVPVCPTVVTECLEKVTEGLEKVTEYLEEVERSPEEVPECPADLTVYLEKVTEYMEKVKKSPEDFTEYLKKINERLEKAIKDQEAMQH